MPKKDDISKDCSQPLPNQGTVSNTWKVSSSMVDICPVLPAQVASRAWISLRGMNDILTYIYLIFYGKSVGKYIYALVYLYTEDLDFRCGGFKRHATWIFQRLQIHGKGPTPIWTDPVPLGTEFAWICRFLGVHHWEKAHDLDRRWEFFHPTLPSWDPWDWYGFFMTLRSITNVKHWIYVLNL